MHDKIVHRTHILSLLQCQLFFQPVPLLSTRVHSCKNMFRLKSFKCASNFLPDKFFFFSFRRRIINSSRCQINIYNFIRQNLLLYPVRSLTSTPVIVFISSFQTFNVLNVDRPDYIDSLLPDFSTSASVFAFLLCPVMFVCVLIHRLQLQGEDLLLFTSFSLQLFAPL